MTKKEKAWLLKTKSEAQEVYTFKTPEEAGKEFEGKGGLGRYLPIRLKAVPWYTCSINGIKTFIQLESLHEAIS